MSEIETVKVPDLERYQLLVDGEPAGYMAYRREGNVVLLVHTEVDDAFAGQGLAGKLTQFALDDVRADGYKADPLCNYVNQWMHKHPEYEDLRA